MAANKFATMIHRKTNKMTLVLIYAVLEWTLIVLLLLNSLFSYFIIKFAQYFGLKQPCLWCARLDRFFEPEKKNSYRDLLCELHSKEVSKLGFCSNHRRLAESRDMCEDCLSSKPGFREESNNFLFSQVKRIDVVQSDGVDDDDDDVNLKCSCCGVNFERKGFDHSSYFVIHPSWDILEFAQKGNSITEIRDDEDHIEKKSVSDDLIRSGSITDHFEENHEIGSEGKNQMLFGDKKERVGVKETEETGDREIEEAIKEDNSSVINRDSSSFGQDMIQFGKEKDSTSGVLGQDLEFFFDYSGNQLVPIELVDSTTEENQNISEVDEDQEFGDYQKAQVYSESQAETVIESVKEPQEFLSIQQGELASVHPNTEESHNGNENAEELLSVSEKTEIASKFAELDSMDLEETENDLVFHAKEIHFSNERVAIAQATQTPAIDTEGFQENAVAMEEDSDSDIHSVHEEASQMQVTDNEEAEVSIGTEIPALDSCDEMKAQDNFSLYSFSHEEVSTSSHDLHLSIENDFEKDQEDAMGELKNLKMRGNLNEIEEERIPDTPSSIDSLNQLHKKLLMLERKESGAEESLDGSVISELDGGDPVNTAEKLKSALKAERKALHALYAELEEERSASAVAANQTMAMINRLQEEKAAMQMEALQYQRMMEEQSEYDQEALQLLNELMTKREKEKQELEKELELYRKKVLDYEAKDRMRFLRRSKDGSTKSGTCSASCSHSEDGDGISVDLNHEAKEEDSFDGNRESQNHNTPIDAVLNLESSLADFEEERLSILEQLKVLEEKLFTLSDEEDQHFADIRPIEDYYEENGRHLNGNYDFDGQELDGVANGFPKEMNGKHHQDRRATGTTGKRLLPLFDAISTESEDGIVVSNGHENGFHPIKLENAAVARFELEKKRIDLEEEVDQLYGRLQALEADREFLKHCIGSLKKGDKGTELLQEILQHLRDLRNVDLRARNIPDGALI